MVRVTSTRAAIVVFVAGCDRMLGLAPVTVMPDAPPDAPPPVVSLRQQTFAMNASANALSATFGSLPASQHVLVMIGAANAGPLVTPTGGGVTAWHLAASSTIHSNVEIWYGTTDGTNGKVDIACTTCATSEPIWLVLFEWDGLDPTNTFDAGTAATGSAAGTASGGMVTTTASYDLLVFGASAMGTVAPTPTPSSWTELHKISVANVSQDEWYRIADAPASHDAQVTVSGTWDAALVAFRSSP